MKTDDAVQKILSDSPQQKKELQRRKQKGLCNALIHHGPGHQSHTYCDIVGLHKKHHALIYSNYEQEAFWNGMKVFSGFFDKPPVK